MNTVVLRCLFLTTLLWASVTCAQVASQDPTNSIQWTDLRIPFSPRFDPPYNGSDPAQIYRELLDTNLIRRIAWSKGLSENDLATVQFAMSEDRLGPKLSSVRLH